MKLTLPVEENFAQANDRKNTSMLTSHFFVFLSSFQIVTVFPNYVRLNTVKNKNKNKNKEMQISNYINNN